MDCVKCGYELITRTEQVQCPQCNTWGLLADVRKVIGNGDSAFPTHAAHDNQVGMSLRDWFAGMALQGIIKSDDISYVVVASEAYKYADAMLKARNKETE